MPTTSWSSRCSARRSGTAWRTCTTTDSSTTASRRATTTYGGAARNGIDKVGAGDRVARRAARSRARRRRRRGSSPATRSRPPTSKPRSASRACASTRGDVLLVRTGHLGVFKDDGDRVGYMRMMPGLGIACAEWLHAREVAAVAADTNSVEVIPFEDPKTPLPLHLRLPARHGPDARRDVRPRRAGRGLRRRRRVGVLLLRPAAAASPARSARRSIRWRSSRRVRQRAMARPTSARMRSIKLGAIGLHAARDPIGQQHLIDAR